MRIFEIVKENVNLREAAELYGIDVNRYSKALCPFHNDRHPSLYVADDHYYCFACGEHGDVIDFVGKLFQLSPYDAARKLMADFHLSPDKPPSAAALHAKHIQYVRPAMQEIESHLSDPLNVDDLAEQLHITPQYLTRLFQRFVGSSVRSYISVLRISRAKELLISRPYTTLDGIAALCGYRDVSYFISVFRQQTGTTPKQFRKLYGI